MKRLALASALALAACTHSGTTASGTATPSGKSGVVGYVRMDELVKKHPLYAQLDRYERDIQALDLTAAAPVVAGSDARVRAEQQRLERELHDAADRTKRILDEKQRDYQVREQQAIAAALGASGAAAPTVAQINGQLQATANGQVQGVARRAQADLDAYRKKLADQDRRELEAEQRAILERADRALRARADQLQQRESKLALDEAQKDAPERLSLRTKQSSLALDDAEREDVQKRIAALDRREADAVAAQRNRDQAEISSYREQLRAQARADVETRANALRGRSEKLIADRATQLRTQLQVMNAPVVAVSPGPGGVPASRPNPALPANIRDRVQRLHQDYQRQFQDDAKKTIADFTKTREDLQRRYDALAGATAGANADAQKQIATLQKRRDDLYGQIVGQIDREVRVIAQQRGINVVFSNVVAPAGGVDLTPDTARDIESLHE